MRIEVDIRGNITEHDDDPVVVIDKTPEQIKSEIILAVQSHLDCEAQKKGYDNILSATSYAGYPNDFQSEGIAFGAWRANVWKYCYAQFEAVQNGERQIPDTEDFILELPTL